MKTQQQFIKECHEKHNNTFDYSKVQYTGAKNKIIIICKIHGEFEQQADSHLQGSGCKKCQYVNLKNQVRMKNEDFILKLKNIYNDKYTYENTVYTNQKEKVKINCIKHGEFLQWPTHAIRGVGCQICSKEFLGFNRSAFIKRSKDRNAIFYILHCFNENESFYKIGITSNSVKERYRKQCSMPYNFKIIQEIFGKPGDIWDMERDMKRTLKKYHYIPTIKFKGHISECFSSIIAHSSS